MEKYFHRFSYHTPQKGDREHKLHQIRDGDAFLECAALLYDHGFQYGKLLLNYPDNEEAKIDTAFLNPGDKIVLTTRPSLGVFAGEGKKEIPRSRTSLEEEIFNHLEKYLSLCSRQTIRIGKEIVKKLPDELKAYETLMFQQNKGASLVKHKPKGRHKWIPYQGKGKTTFGFFLNTNEIWPDGPGLLASFGMGGIETLIWNNYLRRIRNSAWIENETFVLATMEKKTIPDKPIDLDFAKEWEVKILFQCQL